MPDPMPPVAAPHPLKRVAAYRTSDGAIHESRAAAELREAEIAAVAAAADLEINSGVLLHHTDDLHFLLGRLLKARAKVAAE